MAFFEDGYTWPQQHTTYDSVSFSGYEPYGLDHNYGTQVGSQFQEPSSDYGYDYGYGYGYGYGYDYGSDSCANPGLNYLAYNYVEPKLITYEPTPCDTGYISYHTKYSISYSKTDSGFNEPEFEDYDPTPYSGGYDVISTYGKPLPPSDRTCYPRSISKRIEPISTPIPLVEAKLQPEHVPVPEARPEPQAVHVPVVVPQPIPVPTPVPLAEPEHVPMPEARPEPQAVHVPVVVPQPIPVPTPVPLTEPEGLELVEAREREKDEYSYPDYGYDYPWPEYDYGNRIGVGYDYGYGKQVAQIPPFEYDPDVVDLCENIFGSWPCLARIRKQQTSIDIKPPITCPEIGHRNPLEDCASYIFGRPNASYN